MANGGVTENYPQLPYIREEFQLAKRASYRIAVDRRQSRLEGGPISGAVAVRSIAGALDRNATFAHVGSAAAVLGMGVVEFFARKPPSSFVEPMALIGVIGLVFIAVSVAQRVTLKSREEAAKLAEQSRQLTEKRLEVATKRLNEILASDYDHCIYLSDVVLEELRRLPPQARQVNFHKIRRNFNKYVEEVLSQAVSLFTIYTGDQCAVSIKMLTTEKHLQGNAKQALGSEGAKYVWTYARDSQSRVRRAVVDRDPSLATYEWHGHSAFAEVMHSKSQHGYFCSNDLDAMGARYWNANSRRAEFYNATIVCALKNPASEDVVEAMGFLCVDNMRGGFDAGSCRQILEAIASILYYTFRITEEVLDTESEVQSHG